jgi:hypothetical protein
VGRSGSRAVPPRQEGRPSTQSPTKTAGRCRRAGTFASWPGWASRPPGSLLELPGARCLRENATDYTVTPHA